MRTALGATTRATMKATMVATMSAATMLLASVVVVGCGPTRGATQPSGNRLVVARASDATSLDPARATDI